MIPLVLVLLSFAPVPPQDSGLPAGPRPAQGIESASLPTAAVENPGQPDQHRAASRPDDARRAADVSRERSPRSTIVSRHPEDAANRMEARFALWRRPAFSYAESSYGDSSSLDVGVGFHYLRYVAEDVGVGVGVATRARTGTTWSDDDHHDDDDRTSSTRATTFVSMMVRWDFLRRLTGRQTVEPYVIGGVGPVVRGNWTSVDTRHDTDTTYESTTSLGARAGAGFDVRLGRVFTLGVVGAWNWSDRPDEAIGYGGRDRGGEVAVTMGWGW